jgi:2-polyprenyl-3-methyl-5-hydroxy-6-metoxy-1,4-benzoquinol methylase
MKDWNTIYQEKGIFQKRPSAHVLEVIDFFKQAGLVRILDLGCGTGRHTALLVEKGFQVYGCDSSEEAINVVSELFLGLEFRHCDMTALLYGSGFFDGVICNHVIQHGCLSNIRQAAFEIARVIRPDGYLFLIVISTQHPKYFTGREIEPNTKIDTDAVDGHVPHHFFTEHELRELFSNFEILRIEHFNGPSEIDETKESAAWKMLARKAYKSNI